MQTVRRLVGVVMMGLIGFSGGCENAGQGAVSGAGVGAVTGLAIGSLSGNAGRGAAIGAIGGAAGGAMIGDQNRRQSEAASAQAQRDAAQVQAQRETTAAIEALKAQQASPEPTSGNYSTGTPLGNLVGTWTVTGTIDDGDGAPLPIAGTATATIDKNFFVRVDLRFTDPRASRAVEGTLIVSQLGGRTVRLTSFFSSSPVMREFQGDMDGSGSLFNLRQFEPPGGSRRVMIRVSPGRQWTMDAWDGDHRSESLTFAWVGPAN